MEVNDARSQWPPRGSHIAAQMKVDEQFVPRGELRSSNVPRAYRQSGEVECTESGFRRERRDGRSDWWNGTQERCRGLRARLFGRSWRQCRLCYPWAVLKRLKYLGQDIRLVPEVILIQGQTYLICHPGTVQAPNPLSQSHSSNLETQVFNIVIGLFCVRRFLNCKWSWLQVPLITRCT